MNNLVAALLLVGVVPSSASGAAAPPDSTLVIARVTPVLETGALAALDVEMQFTGDADGETALILPRPPAGEQPRFWETVTDVRAENAVVAPGDEPMDRVLTHAPGGAVTLRYRVRPRMTGTRFETIIQPTWFSALGWGLFSELPGRPASIRFEWGPLPAGWTVASDLEHASLARSGAARDPWYELLNSALMGGSDVVVSKRTLGAGTLRIAMRDDLSIEPAAFADVAGRIAMASTALWQDVGSDYFVAINVIPDYRLAQSGIGLGDGYALYIDQKPDPFRLYHTVAHEHMHSWIGRRFNHGGGWFREGFTDHYARLVNLHAGIDSLADFARRWNATLHTYTTSPLRTTPDLEVSAKAFNDPFADDLNESRGSMVAALLDYRLLAATAGRLGLTSVLRAVMRDVDAGTGTGDGPERLIEKAKTLAGVDLQPDIDRHITSGEALLFPADVFGDCTTVSTLEIPTYELGFRGRIGQPLQGVDPSSRAWEAGLRDGMVLLALIAGRPGNSREEIAFRVRDGDEERVVRYIPAGPGSVKLQEVTVKQNLTADAIAACTAKLLR